MTAPSAASVAVTDPVAGPSGRARDLFLVANNIDELGGLQRVAHMLAELFAARGHRVRLIGARPFEPPHHYRSAGTTYTTHVLGERATPDGGGRRGAARLEQPTPQDIARLNELFESVPGGIVICMQIHAMNWVAEAKTSHLRVIGQSHESFAASVGVKGNRTSRFGRIMSLYPDIDFFLLLTRPDAEQFRRVGLNNTAVMPNPVTMRPDTPAALSSPTIITVGRVAPEKNHRDMIEAFARLAPDHPEWTLKIFGDGPLREVLDQQIRAAGLTDRVLLMGPTNDVERELLNASMFALSSSAEGLPLVLVEAMACGVPCVSYDCSPGIREIITDGDDGIVVRQGSVDELSAGLRRLIDEPETRRAMGQQALVSSKRFAPDEVMQLWERFFDTVER
ncbi:MAG TPA: glycosyltransferase family 4 protein [Mycobacteriales bacterium]|nr:glycosyltransferase family 4 protein [Mycobacteriales bacterium]